LLFCLLRSLVSKNEPMKQASSIDNNDDSTSSSSVFRPSICNTPTTARTSVTFTFPSYMEEPIIVYPGAIVCFLQIISCIPRLIDDQVKTK